MNVEVEVVREVGTTYLVQGAKSLESAERIALEAALKKLAGASGVRKIGKREPEAYVTWSQPVIVRDGEIVREEN